MLILGSNNIVQFGKQVDRTSSLVGTSILSLKRCRHFVVESFRIFGFRVLGFGSRKSCISTLQGVGLGAQALQGFYWWAASGFFTEWLDIEGVCLCVCVCAFVCLFVCVLLCQDVTLLAHLPGTVFQL